MDSEKSRGVLLECGGCGERVVLPYIDPQELTVSIVPFTGWTAPPTRCPVCSEKPDPNGDLFACPISGEHCGCYQNGDGVCEVQTDAEYDDRDGHA